MTKTNYNLIKSKVDKLRKDGKSCEEIKNILGISTSLVEYICTQKKKSLKPKKSKKKRNKKKKKLKEFIYRHKRLCGCAKCGNKDARVLEYDHLDLLEKSDSVSRLYRRGVSLNVIKAEIRKCQVLCANCHRIKTGIQFGYYDE